MRDFGRDLGRDGSPIPSSMRSYDLPDVAGSSCRAAALDLDFGLDRLRDLGRLRLRDRVGTTGDGIATIPLTSSIRLYAVGSSSPSLLPPIICC